MVEPVFSGKDCGYSGVDYRCWSGFVVACWSMNGLSVYENARNIGDRVERACRVPAEEEGGENLANTGSWGGCHGREEILRL